MPFRLIQAFIRLEASAGIILLIAACMATGMENSPWQAAFHALWRTSFWQFLPAWLPHTLLGWVNEGLMTVFFLLVGLEIKREMLCGELASFKRVLLPLLAAVGGMLFPALIYAVVTAHVPDVSAGWAIPMATDIAFSLAVIALLGRRIPLSLKIFLMALAIFDDMGAILVIALFYTAHFSWIGLVWAMVFGLGLFVLNVSGVRVFWPYGLLGLALWVSVLASGVHPTLSGIALAAAIPLGSSHAGWQSSPLKQLEQRLHPWVVFGILPLFALANAGVSFAGGQWSLLWSPVTLGIVLGLILGKPLGIVLCSWVGVRLKVATKPSGVSWRGLLGVGLVAGIGFTMSLFMGTLAFQSLAPSYEAMVRLGVSLASIIAAVVGYGYLRGLTWGRV